MPHLGYISPNFSLYHIRSLAPTTSMEAVEAGAENNFIDTLAIVDL
jgi:hypothetical protein